MKKILYFITGIALTIGLGACSIESGGTKSGNDKAPAVTPIIYPTPTEYDVDQTVFYRVFVNNKVASAKVLYEVKKEKDAFIAANSEQEYLEKVVSQGEDLNIVDGVAEVIKEELKNTYAITIVGLDEVGKPGIAKEVIFNGVNWVDVGTIKLSAAREWFAEIFGDADFNLTGLELKLWRSESEPTYLKIESPYDEMWDGTYTGEYDIKVRCNDDGSLSFTNRAESVNIDAIGATVDRVYTGILYDDPYYNFSFGIDVLGKTSSGDFYSYATIDDDGIVTEMVWNLVPIADNNTPFVAWGDLILTPQYNE